MCSLHFINLENTVTISLNMLQGYKENVTSVKLIIPVQTYLNEQELLLHIKWPRSFSLFQFKADILINYAICVQDVK